MVEKQFTYMSVDGIQEIFTMLYFPKIYKIFRKKKRQSGEIEKETKNLQLLSVAQFIQKLIQLMDLSIFQ
jgi:hypothetical protein